MQAFWSAISQARSVASSSRTQYEPASWELPLATAAPKSRSSSFLQPKPSGHLQYLAFGSGPSQRHEQYTVFSAVRVAHCGVTTGLTSSWDPGMWHGLVDAFASVLSPRTVLDLS